MTTRTIYSLVEEEPDSDEFPYVILGIYTTRQAAEAALDNRVAELRAERPGATLWGIDTDEGHWDIDLVIETETLHGDFQ